MPSIDISLLSLTNKASYEWGSVSGRHLCSGQKRGDKVGKTKVGKGSMIMVAIDERGVPLNTVVEDASIYEGHLAEQTVDGIATAKHHKGKIRTKNRFARTAIPNCSLKIYLLFRDAQS